MSLAPLANESQLISQLKQGSEQAFVLIYSHYWKKILLVAWNHTKDKNLAEDLVHDVFLQLWKKRDDIEIESLAGYLSTAIKFSVFKHYRKEQRRRDLLDQNDAYQKDWHEEEGRWEALFLEDYIQGIVEKMPEKCKLVFLMSRQQGLKNPEIAHLLQISEKGVEANLTRALKQLKNQMKKDGLMILLQGIAFHEILNK